MTDYLTQGQRVRLNERGLRVYSKGAAPGRLPLVNWEDRIGTVWKLTCTRKEARVTWQGNRGPSDAIPISLLETTD
jgi:hypothetical protein